MAPVAQLAEAAPVAPPQNLEAEESVLGAMMLSPGAIGAVSEILDASDFYRESHAKIYRAALGLYAKGEPVDAITLVDELEERGELEEAGGRVRLHELAALVPATANAAHYARIVREMATLRGLIAAGQQIAQLGWERPGETQVLVDRAEQVVFELSQSRVSTEFSHIEELLKESFERITALYEAGADVTGVPSGFRDLDRLTSGFQPGNLVIVAARPSMGKSALGLCIAANLALRHETPVAVFTLEMSKSEVTQRLLCSEAKVESQRLRTGKLQQDDWPRLVAAGDKLMKAPIYVDDTGSITMMEIRSKARRLKTRESKLGLIIVDYLQLMTSGTTAENRVQEVSQISRALKVLARDLDVPILAMSQLSRAVEQRHDKRPILSDLRESGCLTGDARVFLPDEGVYRPIRELVGSAGFNVLAVNTETWRLERRPVSRAFATGCKPVYRLRTRLGRTIRATGNHKFLAFDGWRRLDDMGPGLRIALPRWLPSTRQRTMSDAELALLGHVIGDGCTISRRGIRYTSHDRDRAHLVAQLGVDVFGESVKPRVATGTRSYQVSLGAGRHLARRARNPVAEWLDTLGAFGQRAWEKHVPDEVFRQPPDAIAVFLRHLWATDGRLDESNGHDPTIRYDSSSERLTRDVQSLLLRVGINARTFAVSQRDGKTIYRLDVQARDDAVRFLSVVAAVGERPSRAQFELLHSFDGRGEDTSRVAVPRATLARHTTREPGITTRHLQSGPQTSAAALAPVVDSDELARLPISDVSWDEVVSIEPAGAEEVYDLTVDGLHNFVAEDMVVHNSIEQDSDLVMFVYRDEYYNEESDQQGLAEIILAKHRNGPTGTEKLSFLKRYAKFADLAA
jgi:replicative DNA helicase